MDAATKRHGSNPHRQSATTRNRGSYRYSRIPRRALASVAESVEKLSTYPAFVRERVWRILGLPPGEQKHQQVVRLALDGLLYLASLTFAQYRARRKGDPDPEVERQLIAFHAPSAGDYYRLLRLSQKALGDESLLPPKPLSRVKLPEAAAFRRGMEAVELATASGAQRVGAILERSASAGRLPSWYQFWDQQFLYYRNKVIGHFERSRWTDLADYFAVIPPLLEDAVTAALTAEPVLQAVSSHRIGALTSLEHQSSTAVAHRFRCDIAGGEEYLLAETPAPLVRETADTDRGGKPHSSRLYLLDVGKRSPSSNRQATIVGEYFNLFDETALPRPIGEVPPAYRYVDIWAHATDEEKAVRVTQRLLGSSAATTLVTLVQHVNISITRDGTATIAFRNRCANVGHGSVTAISQEVWFEHPQEPLVIETTASTPGGASARVVRDYGNLKQFVCEFSQPIEPLAKFDYSYSYRAPQMFRSDHYWDQRVAQYCNQVLVHITHDKGLPIQSCSVLEESPTGLVLEPEPNLRVQTAGEATTIDWRRTFPKGGSLYRIAWEFQNEEAR